MSKKFILVLVLISAVAVDASAQGCSMCKAVAQSGSENGQNLSGGLNDAILYLMAAPYLLLFVFFRKKIFTFLKELRGLWS
jgi:hypothetical protein